MVELLRIKLFNWINVLQLLHRIGENNYSFYSDINGPFIKYLISGECYYIYSNNQENGILSINRRTKELIYIPIAVEGISFFRLLYTLTINFELKGYSMTVIHKKLNVSLYKKFFNIKIIDNHRNMYLPTDNTLSMDINLKANIRMRKMELHREESLRVMLQNNIFKATPNRNDLTLLEVYNEEKKPNFINDMCYILEEESIPIGYGQIIVTNGDYYLVNFGIIDTHRGRGFSRYFLKEILNCCKAAGIETLKLCVDNENYAAINLYKKAGFKDENSQFILKFN